MAIKHIEIKDFLVFKGDFVVDFCTGVNVIIGGNATGKTTLLKVLRLAYDKTIRVPHEFPCIVYDSNMDFEDDVFYTQTVRISKFFPYSGFNEKHLMIEVSDDGNSTRITEVLNIMNPDWERDEHWHMIETKGDNQINELVYIPVNEMLTHSEGLLALNNVRKLPFDKTYIDILSMASMPETHDVPSNAKKALSILEKIIGGTVVVENDVFFILREDNKKIPFSLTASGFKKLGLLWKLLRNGLLEPGSILFWDEPENSLNPELVPVLVDILLELSRNGVQIFIATHSEILASYFDVSCRDGDEVMFASLYKEGDFVKVNTGDRFNWLEPNNLTEAPVRLYEKKLDKGLGCYG